MADLSVVATRDPLVESTHHVSAIVVDDRGRMLAHAGDPDLVTFWRSAAKPFQLLPLLEDGGGERFGLDASMLALACASHNAEPIHREVGARWLRAIDLPESALACGGHLSLAPSVAEAMVRDRIEPTPLWSNCSGKHSAMLGLAKLHGWPTAGYQALDHPGCERVAQAIASWTAAGSERLKWGVDGCTAPAVALSLREMALAYARLGTTTEAAAGEIRDAMLAEPYLIAGKERLDTAVMEAWSGRVIAKIGAEGVYSASLPTLGLGVALKVEDGDMKSAGVALMAVLEAVVAHADPGAEWPVDELDDWRSPLIRNTRGEPTGRWAIQGKLVFA